MNIVAHGLGGILSAVEGYGGENFPITTDGNVIEIEGGSLVIVAKKFRNGCVIDFRDSDNHIMAFFELTAQQLSGSDWFTVKAVREAQTLKLKLSVENSTEQEFALNSAVPYTNGVKLFRDLSGSMYDIKVLPRAVSQGALEYYLSDVIDNNGKVVVPQ